MRFPTHARAAAGHAAIFRCCTLHLGFMFLGLILALSSFKAEGQTKAAAPLVAAPAANGATHGNRVSQWLDLTPELTRSTQMPRAAEDCAMMYNPITHRIILFGGKNDNDENLDEVWSLDLATHRWEQIAAENEGPPASEDHTVIYDPLGHRMIIFGGENGFTTNHTWAFDFETRRWRNITAADAPAREDHTAIYDSHGKRMIIFGGRYNDGEVDYINIHEVWALDLDPSSATFEKWQNLTK